MLETIQALQEGVTVKTVLENLKQREKQFQQGVSFAERGKMIQRLFPDVYASIIEKAEHCLNGFTVLPGSSLPHFIGNPVKWHENIYHYDEYTYQLNRMVHWRTMAEAYSFTGDERYAKKIIEEFYHWIEYCPCQPLYAPDGSLAVEDFGGCKCNQGIWRSLEVGIRMYRTWPYIIHHLIDSGFIDETFLEVYLGSVYQHAQILYLVAPKIWPNADHNHYLMENNGLLYLSCMFPEFRDANIWREHAIHEMERSIEVQVTEGGGQIEGCASYHNGCSYWFALPVLLAGKYGFEMSEHYRERLKKMLEYSVHATRPCGGNSSWGDSSTYSGTLSMGAFSYYLAFQDSSYMKNALCYYSLEDLMRQIADQIWEVPDLQNLAEQLDGIEEKRCLPKEDTISWQKGLKQVFLRTDWSQDAFYVMFGCRTPVQNLHAHMDPAGFEFSAYGRVLLGDPAIYYYKDDENRRHLKSAHWHNCLTLNHEDPWEYRGSWAYGKQKPGDILNAARDGRLIYAVGEHRNYEPAVHRRAVAIVDRKFLAVMDILEHVTPDSSVQINFHMDSHCVMADSEKSFAVSVDPRANVAVYSDKRLKPSLVPAKISTKNDVWHDTMIARFEAEHLSEGRHAFLSVACPAPAGQQAAEVTEVSSELLDDGTVRFGFTVEQCSYELVLSGNVLSLCSDRIEENGKQ
ncbi:MAG: heparinase II/III family protein [Eubacteriales bacterium]|nr:heparinase II/III family protein [Eubacteriales bacterium]